jgi:glycosyltransferase involved in cell wall biosynthesis
MSKLSVVLISKDQEWNIARLITSVLKETNHLSTSEIVLVDSASKDCTTEIAAQYPIKVLKLHSDQHLSASAGRYVGYNHTKGDLVLFLDGDMELCNGWLDRALDIMHSRPDVAVVSGMVINRPITSQEHIEDSALPNRNSGGDFMEVSHGGGAAMYRRSVLEELGSFNPYLYSDEEPELCLRIRHAGHRILRLSHPIVFHYSHPVDYIQTLLLRRNRNLWIGFGQNIRYFWGSPLLYPYLKERGWVVVPALVLCVGIISAIVTGMTSQWVWLVSWGALVMLIVVATVIKKRSMRRAFFSLFQRLLILEGTVRGLLLKPFDPAGYPGRYDIVH